MKKNVIFTLLILSFSCICHAQKNLRLPVKLNPFLTLENLKAVGNSKTGTVKISMDLWNHFGSPISGLIKLETFKNFGVTDEHGRMYEFSLGKNGEPSNKKNDINYSAIGEFEYQSKKIDRQRTLKIVVPPGAGRRFSFLLVKVDRKVNAIQELHVKYDVLIGKEYQNYTKNVGNFKIRWK
uniref:hypothetical protein n=1 Tax=Pedobacter schmidteae TaxID=2201271 RepID=UPI000EB181A7|nr:hypothetical protein [Pedobacter schmidteae]